MAPEANRPSLPMAIKLPKLPKVPSSLRRRTQFGAGRRRDSIGAPPGTINVDPGSAAPVIRVIAYGPDGVNERIVGEPELLTTIDAPMRWIDVVGLGDAKILEQVGAIFGVHPLALEDVAHQHQRPKVDAYGETLFVVVHMPETEGGLSFEQISMFIGKGFLLTFQEGQQDCFDRVRERIRTGKGRIRTGGSDYLAYALIDAAVDNYFPLVDASAERLDAIEAAVMTAKAEDALTKLLEIKRSLLGLRRYVRPLRDVLAHLVEDQVPAIAPETRIYLRDCLDHTAQLMDVVEMQRDLTVSLADLHLSVASQRMNEIMKVLTIIATIFMPLSFIAGVYGMNFNTAKSPYNMPELDWYWGYPAAMGLMALIAFGFVYYFYRAGWIGSRKRRLAERGSDAAR